MEFGKGSTFTGRLKRALYERVDPIAREAKRESEKKDIRDTLRVRRSTIDTEQQFRADLRSGKANGGVRDYAGSLYRESRNKAKIRGLEEKLDPNLKRTRKLDKDFTNFERRQRISRGFDKVTDAYDQIGSAFDSIGGGGGGKKSRKGGGNSFGLSDHDIMELSGLGGTSFGGMGMGGSSRKGKKRSGGQVPIYRGSRVVGYRQVSGGSMKRKSKGRKAPGSWADIDIDI